MTNRYVKNRNIYLKEGFTDYILYHGTNSSFDIFDIDKSGMINHSDWGKGIYFTRSKNQAHSYRIDAVKHTNKEYNDAYDNYVKAEKQFRSSKYGTQEYVDLNKLRLAKVKEFQQIGRELNSSNDGRLVVAKIKPTAKIYKFNSTDGLTDPYLADTVKNKGYDIILVDSGRYTEEFVVLNIDSIDIIGEIKGNE